MPIRITTKAAGEYVDIVAETNAVDSAFLHYVLDEIEKAQIRQPNRFLKVLLEVIAPQLDISLMQGFDVFRRAKKLGMQGAEVAYVITGRPADAKARVIEAAARKQGILLRFFVSRDCALKWLNVSATGSDRVA